MYLPRGLALPLEQLGNQIRAKQKEKAHTESTRFFQGHFEAQKQHDRCLVVTQFETGESVMKKYSNESGKPQDVQFGPIEPTPCKLLDG